MVTGHKGLQWHAHVLWLNLDIFAAREAFAAWLPFWGVPFSYGVAISYVLVDTADKGIKAYQLARSELGANA